VFNANISNIQLHMYIVVLYFQAGIAIRTTVYRCSERETGGWGC